MNIKPIRGQVVVLPDPPPLTTDAMINSLVPPERRALIHVPDVAGVDNPNYFTETGRVVALAPHSFTEDGEEPTPFDVQIGDRVHFNRFAGKQVTCSDDGVLYLVMFEREIRAVVEGDHRILHGYEAAKEDEVKSYDRDPFEGM